MINRTLKQLTGIKEILNFNSEKKCINYLRNNLDYKGNKWIKPNL